MDFILLKILKISGSPECRWMTKLTGFSVDTWIAKWLIPFLAAAIIALATYEYFNVKNISRRRRIILTVLRSVAYLIILLMLALPSLDIEGEGAPPGIVPLAIDCTESMGINDCDGKTRLEFAEKACNEIVGSNSHGAELLVKTFSSGKEFIPYKAGSNSLKKDCDYTSLNQMIERIVSACQGDYCPGALIISDGAHNTSELPENAVRILKKNKIPLYFCAVGKEKPKDVSLAYLMGEDVVFMGEKAKLFVNINQTGYTGDNFELQLFLGEKNIFSSVYKFEKDGETSVPVEYVPDEKGLFQLRASVKPLSGEITEENNIRVKNIRVIDEKIKALLLFGVPSWEFRYLNGSFERDKRMERKAWLLSADKRLFRKKTEGSVFIPEIPANDVEFNKMFDIVFISRTDVSLLPEKTLTLLRDFVENKGGGMVIICDPDHVPFSFKGTVLEDLLPVSLSGAAPETYREELLSPVLAEHKFSLTDEGVAHQLTAFSGDRAENRKLWSELPSLYWIYPAKRIKPSGICLVEVEEKETKTKKPAIVYHSFGRGTVLYMAFDSTWRWRKEFGDRFFRDFWGRAVQFMGLPHLLEESAASAIFAAKENYSTGEKISVRAKVSNPDFSYYTGDSIELSVDESGVRRNVKMQPVNDRPGMFKAEFVSENPGTLKLEIDQKFCAKPLEIRIMKQQREFADSGMNRKLMEKIAADTGGAFFTSGNASEIPGKIWENRRKIPMKVRFSLWDSFLPLISVLVILSIEWLLRKIYYID